jgi:hypothetical protein
MTKEFVANTVLTQCGAPTTIDLTSVLSQMPGAQISMVNVPTNGVMSQPKPFVWVFTPNANFCALGGNDQLIMRVVDEKGNVQLVQRNISAVQQGDIPSVISTGYEESTKENNSPLQSNAYPILLSWLMVGILTNFRERSTVDSLK